MKRLFAFILTLALAVGVAPAAFADEAAAPPLYVALGDSIASYYQLQKGEGYAELLCAALQNDYPGLTLKNLARPGDTTADLLQVIDSYGGVIADADIITVSIGANDFLMDAISPFSRAIVLGGAKEVLTADIMKIIKGEVYHNTFTRNITQMRDNLVTIYTTLRELAPNAGIYLSRFYNPLPITDKAFYFPVEEYIMEANNALSTAGGYVQVDTFNAFFLAGGLGLTNFDWENGSIDPHPTKLGHKILAAVHAEAITGEPRDIPEPAEVQLTRAEAVAAICDSLLNDLKEGKLKIPPIKIDISTFEPFGDVPNNHPQATQIKIAAAIGLISGSGKGTFRPDEPITPAGLEQLRANAEKLLAQ
ncbi:MAG: GDSL-type esterase/lipase family protein [Oscillospiraceae bacterium]|jgi:lysophospholipase L1-like esterase|nr:GDSL-type esterase/lipase family protein [Oscillospiraceae bacterium]